MRYTKIKKKEPKQITKENHQYKRKDQEKKGTENYKNNQKTMNKMVISTYLQQLL